MALVIALMSILLMTALGIGLVLTTLSETMIAANFRNSTEGLYAADAVLERVMDDLLTVPDWNHLLAGSVQSGFTDGAPTGSRTLPDGSTIDLDQAINMANCQRVAPCTVGEMNAETTERPWGPNNPRWKLYAYGPLNQMTLTGTIDSPYYVMLMVADDGSENDADPTKDGASQTNPGTGVLSLRAEAFGPRSTHKIVEVTVARNNGIGQAGVRILSWREAR